MFHIKPMVAMTLSTAALCICFAACGQESPQPSQTQPTGTVTTTQSTSPAETSAPTEVTEPTAATETVTQVPVQFNGLHFYLDTTFTTAEADGKLTFQSQSIQGGVEFDTLSKLTGGFAQTSADYATYLQKELQEEHEKIWVGSSTGIGYYVVLQDADHTRVQCLYVKGNDAWNVWAESGDNSLTEDLIAICAKCSTVSPETE